MEGVQPTPAGVSMAHLLAAFDGLGANACILGPDGKVRWANDRWRRFAADRGLPTLCCDEGADYLAGCISILPPDDPAVRCLRQVVAGERTEFACDLPCSASDEPRWIHLVARSFHLADGDCGTIVVHNDATERTLADAKRAAQKNQLAAQRVEALGTSIRAIAHEFNNVLTTLVGNLELARMRTLPPAPIAELLAEMAIAVDRSRSLVVRLHALTQEGAWRPESSIVRPSSRR